MEFHPEMPLSPPVAEAIARGLIAVAKADGLHEHEAGLISSFWMDAGGGAGALTDLLRRPNISTHELAAALRTPAERTVFIKTALLLSYADGKVTDVERKVVSEFATALGIDRGTLGELEAGVKEFLLGQLVHLKNTDVTRVVAQKLKV